jgi:hypothetical protein
VIGGQPTGGGLVARRVDAEPGREDLAIEVVAADVHVSGDHQALRDPSVAGPLAASFVPLRIDVTEATDASMALRERYAAQTVPALVFVAPDGSVVGRVTEYLDPPQLVEAIQAAAAHLPR